MMSRYYFSPVKSLKALGSRSYTSLQIAHKEHDISCNSAAVNKAQEMYLTKFLETSVVRYCVSKTIVRRSAGAAW